jgi:hypothetical protein
MKHSALCKFTRGAILSLSLALVPLAGPASAQVSKPETTDRQTTRAQETRAERPFDWSWLGLLGLAGLLGLLPRGDRERRRVAMDSAGRTTARP